MRRLTPSTSHSSPTEGGSPRRLATYSVALGGGGFARRHGERDAVEQLGAHLFAQRRVALALALGHRAGALEQVHQKAAQLAEHGGVGVVQAGGGVLARRRGHMGLVQRAVHLDADHHVALRRAELEAAAAREHVQRVGAGGQAAEARVAFHRKRHADGEHVGPHPAGLVHGLVQVFNEQAHAVELQPLHGAIKPAARELQVTLVPAGERGGLFVDVAVARDADTSPSCARQRRALHWNGGHGGGHGLEKQSLCHRVAVARMLELRGGRVNGRRSVRAAGALAKTG